MLPHMFILLGLSLGGIAADGAERLIRGTATADRFLRARPGDESLGPESGPPFWDASEALLLEWRIVRGGKADPLSRTMREGRYQAAERSVSNWQWEAATRLELGPVAALAALVKADRPVVARCVKLNNYWCIKSAGWTGEVGFDDEGHVGFASAERGADAAAILLRRYYLEFGRKSALDIVRRWAPAECRLVGSAGTAAVLAVRGIGGTVRARYLASRRRVRVAATGTGAPKPAPTLRVSAVIPRPLPVFQVPDIALGMGEKPLTVSSTLPYRVARPRPAAKPSRALPVVGASTSTPSATPPMPPPVPRLSCAPDEQRLRNYAGRIVEGLNRRLEDDLDLFAPDGMPTANLKPVMLAMSAFELGTLRAREGLVEEAVERQRARAGHLPGAEGRSDAPDTDPRSGLRLRREAAPADP